MWKKTYSYLGHRLELRKSIIFNNKNAMNSILLKYKLSFWDLNRTRAIIKMYLVMYELGNQNFFWDALLVLYYIVFILFKSKCRYWDFFVIVQHLLLTLGIWNFSSQWEVTCSSLIHTHDLQILYQCAIVGSLYCPDVCHYIKCL